MYSRLSKLSAPVPIEWSSADEIAVVEALPSDTELELENEVEFENEPDELNGNIAVISDDTISGKLAAMGSNEMLINAVKLASAAGAAALIIVERDDQHIAEDNPVLFKKRDDYKSDIPVLFMKSSDYARLREHGHAKITHNDVITTLPSVTRDTTLPKEPGNIDQQLDMVQSGALRIEKMTASVMSSGEESCIRRFIALGGDVFDPASNWAFDSHVVHRLILEDWPLLIEALEKREANEELPPDLDRVPGPFFAKEFIDNWEMPKKELLARNLLFNFGILGIFAFLAFSDTQASGTRYLFQIVFWELLFTPPFFVIIFFAWNSKGRASLRRPTPLQFALLLGGPDDAARLLLHLRDCGRVKFDLGAKTAFGHTAAQLARTATVADELFLAHLLDIAKIAESKRAELVRKGLDRGCNRKFILGVLAEGNAGIVDAAVRLALSPHQHRHGEIIAAADDAIGAVLDECHGRRESMVACFWKASERFAKDGNLFGGGRHSLMIAMCTSKLEQSFTHPLMQASCREALGPNGLTGVWDAGGAYSCGLFFAFSLTNMLSVLIPPVFRYPGVLLYTRRGLELGFAILYTATALSSSYAPTAASNIGSPLSWLWVFISPFEDALTHSQTLSERGGAIDEFCLLSLCFTLLYEGAEFWFKGPWQYVDTGNMVDVMGTMLLVLVFVVRLLDDAIDDGEYAPESIPLAFGLGLLWARALLNVASEFKGTAVLIAVIKEVFLNDVAIFLVVVVIFFIAFSVTAAAMSAKVVCFEAQNTATYHNVTNSTNVTVTFRDDYNVPTVFHDPDNAVGARYIWSIDELEISSDVCYLEQPYGAVTTFKFIAAQLLWPVLDVDDPGIDDNLFDAAPNDRKVFGPLFMGVFAVVFLIVLLNILIAMLSSTYEAVMGNAQAAFCKYRAKLIVEMRSLPMHSGPFYIYEIVMTTLWARCTKRFNKDRYGFRYRPGFEWEMPDFDPGVKALEAADTAMADARDQLLSKALESGFAPNNDNQMVIATSAEALEAKVNKVEAEIAGVKAEIKHMEKNIDAKMKIMEENMDAKFSEIMTFLKGNMSAA